MQYNLSHLKAMNIQTTVLFYLFIGIFSLTAIITLLGITGILKTIKDKYLNALFGALILEVVAAVILSYKQIDLNCDSDAVIDKLISKTNQSNLSSKDDKVELLSTIIREYYEIKPLSDSLTTKLTSTEETLEQCLKEHSHSGKEFLNKIIRLREITRNEMDGTSINLVFDQEGKREVFKILEQVFKSIGKYDPGKEFSNDYIISLYITFLESYTMQEKLVSMNEAGNYTGVYVTDYVTSLFLRVYLERFYPIT